MRIEHLAIWAEDLDALKAFYETYFGASVSLPYHNAAKQFTSYFLSFASGARLELMHRPGLSRHSEEGQGLAHLAWSTGSVEAVDRLTEKLRQAGRPILDGPRWTGDGYYESVVLDPEGNRLEITV